MNQKKIAIIGVLFLFTILQVHAEEWLTPRQDLGEAIIVNVDYYEPRNPIRHAMLEQQDVPVYAHLQGVTAGTMLSRLTGDTQYTDPVTQITNIPPIRDIRLTPANITYEYVRNYHFIRPDNRQYSLDNLGTLLVILKQQDTEKIPERIDLTFDAEIRFDLKENLYGISNQDLILKEISDQATWDQEITTQKDQYSFFSQAGFIRATQIDDRSATFTIYNRGLSALTLVSPTMQTTGLRVQSATTLQEGETSRIFSLAQTGDPLKDYFQIKVNKIVNPQDTAHIELTANGKTIHKRIVVNEQLYEGSSWVVKRIAVKGNKHLVELRNNQGKKEILEVTFDPTSSNYKPDLTEQEAQDLIAKYCPQATTEYACKAIEQYNEFTKDYPSNPKAPEMYEKMAEIFHKKLLPVHNLDPTTHHFEMMSLAFYYYTKAFDQATDFAIKNSVETELNQIRSGDYRNAEKRLEDEYVIAKLLFIDEIKPEEKAQATIAQASGTEDKYAINDFLKRSDGGILEGTEVPDTQSISYKIKSSDCALSQGKYTYRYKITNIASHSVTVERFCKDAQGEFSIQRGSSKRLISDEETQLATLINSITDETQTTSFTLRGVDPKREVHVTILPGTGEAVANSQISFHVMVDKRPGELTPEKLQKRIAKTQETIKKLDKTITNLEKINKVWRKTCVGVFLFLTAKNAFAGKRNYARDDVMGYYRKVCNQDIHNNKFGTYDECYNAYGAEIENKLQKATKELEQVNSEMRQIQKEYQKAEDPEVLATQKSTVGDYARFRLAGGDATEFRDNLKLNAYNQTFTNDPAFGTYVQETQQSIGVQTKIALYDQAKALKTQPGLENEPIENIIDRMQAARELKEADLDNIDAQVVGQVTANANDPTLFTAIAYDENTQQFRPVALKRIDQCEYLTAIRKAVPAPDECEKGNYLIRGKREVYTPTTTLNFASGPLLYTSPTTVHGEQVLTTTYSYQNSIPVEYDNDGFALCYPIGKGNYVKVLERYKTNEIKTLVLKNVGPDGKVDCGPGGDDEIVQDESILSLPEKAAEKGQLKNKEPDRCTQDGQKVGTLEGKSLICSFNTAKLNKMDAQPACAEHMDPTDCALLFNACDPVMCPASRCNFGGKWQVDDVISSGIVGSALLCAPNVKQGVAVPVCLTGITAGLKNIKSLLQEYADCTKEQLDTGKNVAICDKIRSIGTCELLWREAGAIIQLKGGLLNWVTRKEEGSQGGAEYLNFQASLKGASDSFNYFTSTYEQTYLAAYKGKSTQEIGTQVCKEMITGKAPKIGDIFEQISEVEEPPQFAAYFDALPYAETIGTTVGVPGQGILGNAQELTEYDIYYHIYAGQRFSDEQDQAVKYAVYLKNPQGEIHFVTYPNNGPRYGTIANEDYAAQNIMTVAKSGFNEVCVWIDGKEYCGFKRVSTDKGLELLSDGIQSSEAQRKITSAEQCVPEAAKSAPALGSVILPGQSGLVSGTVTRVCSINIPTNEPDRWKVVGSCGEQRGSCWLDATTLGINSPLINTQLQTQLAQSTQMQAQYISAQQAQQIYVQLHLLQQQKIQALQTFAKQDTKKTNLQGFIDEVERAKSTLTSENKTYEDLINYAATPEISAQARIDLAEFYTTAADIQRLYKKEAETRIEQVKPIWKRVQLNQATITQIGELNLPEAGEYVIYYEIIKQEETYATEPKTLTIENAAEASMLKQEELTKLQIKPEEILRITGVIASKEGEQSIQETIYNAGQRACRGANDCFTGEECLGATETEQGICTSRTPIKIEAEEIIIPEAEEQPREEIACYKKETKEECNTATHLCEWQDVEGKLGCRVIDAPKKEVAIALIRGWTNEEFLWNGFRWTDNEGFENNIEAHEFNDWEISDFKEGLEKIKRIISSEEYTGFQVTCAQEKGEKFSIPDSTQRKVRLQEQVDQCIEVPKVELRRIPEKDKMEETILKESESLGCTLPTERSAQTRFARLLEVQPGYEETLAQMIQRTTDDYEAQIEIAALMSQESLFLKNPVYAVSPTGAAGVMQFIYSTAKEMQDKYGQFTGEEFIYCCSGKYRGDCSTANNACKAAGYTDGRFDAQKAIAAAHYVLESKQQYIKLGFGDCANRISSDNEYIRAFTIGGYNGGEEHMCNAVKATGKKDPTWQEIAPHLRKETKCYVPAVYKYKALLRNTDIFTPTGNATTASSLGPVNECDEYITTEDVAQRLDCTSYTNSKPTTEATRKFVVLTNSVANSNPHFLITKTGKIKILRYQTNATSAWPNHILIALENQATKQDTYTQEQYSAVNALLDSFKEIYNMDLSIELDPRGEKAVRDPVYIQAHYQLNQNSPHPSPNFEWQKINLAKKTYLEMYNTCPATFTKTANGCV